MKGILLQQTLQKKENGLSPKHVLAKYLLKT